MMGVALEGEAQWGRFRAEENTVLTIYYVWKQILVTENVHTNLRGGNEI